VAYRPRPSQCFPKKAAPLKPALSFVSTVTIAACFVLVLAHTAIPSESELVVQEDAPLEKPICKIGGTLSDDWYIFAQDDADNWSLSCPRPTTLDDPHYNVWRTTPAVTDRAQACRDTPLPKGYSIREKLFHAACPVAGLTMLGDPIANAYILERQGGKPPGEMPVQTDRYEVLTQAGTTSPEVNSSEKALDHAALGNDYFTRLRYTEAEAQFRAAGNYEPWSADWPALVALTLVLQEKYAAAETEAQVAVRLDPKNAVAHAALAAALGSLGKWRDAELESRVGMRLDPIGTQGIPGLSQFVFGVSLWHLGKKEEAEQILRHVVQRFDRYQGKLAQVLFEDGKLDEAEAQYREALRLRPDDRFLAQGLDNVVKAREHRK
jgi:tetratricopeptide (TPR) repeat protein